MATSSEAGSPRHVSCKLRAAAACICFRSAVRYAVSQPITTIGRQRRLKLVLHAPHSMSERVPFLPLLNSSNNP
ncbi:hypothetical protein K504DRAFT_64644 [Pleomassaria siparia CBS 279.74]|uniref:Uncharacterized protein n=1 Tax=Pleomassaria siparia CBS 279.74 TaxID=1314801 RepID=A0A6G1K2J6_9PLEO|nr:hypothetical protein K504DRAFT_64644 [Pleomassaria siparia CBS 279.74]